MVGQGGGWIILKQTNGSPADWGEKEKEAPTDYILKILKTVFPDAKIENYRGRNILGCDWKICYPSGTIAVLDDKNDSKLGITGNVALDKETTKLHNGCQLLMNFPMFEGKYIIIFNKFLDGIDLDKWTHTRPQSYGGSTSCYVVSVSDIDPKPYHNYPPLANPNYGWFTKEGIGKRKKKTKEETISRVDEWFG
jgi:hypothetical protein